MADAAPLPLEALTPPGGGPGARPGPGRAEGAEGAEGLFVVLGAGLAAASHPLLYVKLLVQVGHEPLPPTIGRNVLGKKVLYLPGFFTYEQQPSCLGSWKRWFQKIKLTGETLVKVMESGWQCKSNTIKATVGEKSRALALWRG
ncbi:uncharacterized protein [Anas platyrhynchos]|uniref:uncharacterized protein isoform X1 n=1 Tax=Anas platyrhynchos TaxID=8839 RepID=UPI0018D7C53E|nr:mitochondrial carrier homolog 1-like isoform X1 [Anas platyrhynchos]